MRHVKCFWGFCLFWNIANVFYRAGIIEKWGTGTLNIIEWCKENKNPLPEWSIRSGSVILTFKPSLDKNVKQLKAQPELQPESQPELQPELQTESLRDKVINLLQEKSLSKSAISKRLRQKQISGQLKKVIKELLAEGIVEYSIPEKPTSKLQTYKLIRKDQ